MKSARYSGFASSISELENPTMSNQEWINYKIEIRDRLRAFSLEILSLFEMLPEKTRGKVLNYQLTKSGTSMYANYRAALRSRSKAEFFSKLTIAIEEADKTENVARLDNRIGNTHNRLCKIVTCGERRIAENFSCNEKKIINSISFNLFSI